MRMWERSTSSAERCPLQPLPSNQSGQLPKIAETLAKGEELAEISVTVNFLTSKCPLCNASSGDDALTLAPHGLGSCLINPLYVQTLHTSNGYLSGIRAGILSRASSRQELCVNEESVSILCRLVSSHSLAVTE